MLSFLPLDVLDEIWDVIESVSEGFLTYSLIFAPGENQRPLSIYQEFMIGEQQTRYQTYFSSSKNTEKTVG